VSGGHAESDSIACGTSQAQRGSAKGGRRRRRLRRRAGSCRGRIAMASCESEKIKRLRGFPLENHHAAWATFANGIRQVDYLRLLYPHPRDADCTMDEITHTYHVLGERYPCSVSAVWKVFFPVFKDGLAAALSLKSAKTKGIKNMASSVYNLVQFLSLHEQLNPNEDAFLHRTRLALAEADRLYELEGWAKNWEARQALEEVRAVIAIPGLGKKPVGRDRCYFLALCAGCTPESLRSTWKIGGELEAFKGTYLHKQAELLMQEMGAYQLEQGNQKTALRELMGNSEMLARWKNACSPEATMAALVLQLSPNVWDHPGTQVFLGGLRNARQSPEFLRFEAWLRANPGLSPFRAEWSIYNEDERVAGQVDSLWFDTNLGNEIFMVDWKRAKELLTEDPVEQRKQCYGKTGLLVCASAPGVRGPCSEDMDCSFNHYLAQQHIYAHFLRIKYGVDVKRMALVQCHPDVGSDDESFNEAVLKKREGFAAELIAAFAAGWKDLR